MTPHEKEAVEIGALQGMGKLSMDMKLLPCPFCGNTVKSGKGGVHRFRDMIGCYRCGAQAPPKIWNRRVTVAPDGTTTQDKETKMEWTKEKPTKPGRYRVKYGHRLFEVEVVTAFGYLAALIEEPFGSAPSKWYYIDGMGRMGDWLGPLDEDDSEVGKS